MKNKYIISIISFVLISILVIQFYYLKLFADQCHGFIIGDWLITYHGGFVRRGLGGYLMVMVSDLLKVSPNYTVSLIQITCILLYTIIFFILFYGKKLNVWFMILIFSPITLFFSVLDVSAMGRKEIILFVLFVLFILFLKKKTLDSNFLVFLFFLALTVATFFHELMFFYTPYFILSAYLKSKVNNEPFHLSKVLIVISGSFFAMIPLSLYGMHINGSVICEELMKRGLSSNVCTGILSWPNTYWVKDVFNVAIKFDYFWFYGIAIILGLVPFLLFIKYSEQHLVTMKSFFVAFIFLFLFSSPLFILAIDWGRWINIHFMLLLFTSTLLLKDKSYESQAGWSNKYIEIPKLWKSKSIVSKLLNNIVFILLWFLYITMGFMPHCYSFSVNRTLLYRTIHFLGVILI